ncbi:hypothetical protein YC2023_050450 [Brassica napus]
MNSTRAPGTQAASPPMPPGATGPAVYHAGSPPMPPGATGAAPNHVGSPSMPPGATGAAPNHAASSSRSNSYPQMTLNAMLNSPARLSQPHLHPDKLNGALCEQFREHAPSSRVPNGITCNLDLEMRVGGLETTLQSVTSDVAGVKQDVSDMRQDFATTREAINQLLQTLRPPQAPTGQTSDHQAQAPTEDFRQSVCTSRRFSLKYPDDVYDRVWFPFFHSGYKQITTNDLNISNTDTYKVPKTALVSAATPKNASFSPPKLELRTLYTAAPVQCDSEGCNLQLVKTPNSTLPPLINAIEVYTVIEFPQVETSQNDGISRLPLSRTSKLLINYVKSVGKEIHVSLEIFPGKILDAITQMHLLNQESLLYLSKSRLTGSITPILQNLTQLQELNLIGNNLTGSVPQALLDRKKGLVLKGQKAQNLLINMVLGGGGLNMKEVISSVPRNFLGIS